MPTPRDNVIKWSFEHQSDAEIVPTTVSYNNYHYDGMESRSDILDADTQYIQWMLNPLPSLRPLFPLTEQEYFESILGDNDDE